MSIIKINDVESQYLKKKIKWLIASIKIGYLLILIQRNNKLVLVKDRIKDVNKRKIDALLFKF